MPTASKRQMNWSGVTFTPQGGSAVVLTGVTNVEYDSGGSLVSFSGDGDLYESLQVNDMNAPRFTITLADLGAVGSISNGTRGTFAATHNDARNKTGTGAITYTGVNAIVSTRTAGGQHRQVGSGTLAIAFESPDGQTNPVTTSAA